MHTMKQNHPPQPVIHPLHFGHEPLLHQVSDRPPGDGVVVGEDGGEVGDGYVGGGGGGGEEGEGEVFFGVAEIAERASSGGAGGMQVGVLATDRKAIE